MSTGKVLLGVLAGVAAGALLGVLLAPEKGSVIRKKITDGGDDLIDELKGKFNELCDSVSEKYQSVKDDGTALVNKTKAKAGEVKSEVEHLAANHK